jgi:hypothetical protein
MSCTYRRNRVDPGQYRDFANTGAMLQSTRSAHDLEVRLENGAVGCAGTPLPPSGVDIRRALDLVDLSERVRSNAERRVCSGKLVRVAVHPGDVALCLCFAVRAREFLDLFAATVFRV